MYTNILFFLILSSGSVWCAARFHKRYEEVLPLSCMSIVLILFVCGILGMLKAGVYIVLFLVALMYFTAVYYVLKTRSAKLFIKNILTPGAIVFFLALFAFSFFNAGKLASSWDEFSHWMDIVKVMTTLDDFGTNPMSHSLFFHYPPGMSLFQYFLQKIYLFFNPDQVFNEWRAFLAYQVLFFVVLFPFFSKISFKRPLASVTCCILVFVSPLLFYGNIYEETYIDAFLGILSGAGLTMIFVADKKDFFYSLYIWMLCAMLVLSKDAGTYFAVFLAGAYIVDILSQRQKSSLCHSKLKTLLCTSAAILSVWLPRCLWKIETQRGSSISASGAVDKLLSVLSGQDNSYLSSFIGTYHEALYSRGIQIGYMDLKLSYVTVIITFQFLLYLLYKLYAVKDPMKRQSRALVTVTGVAQMIFYCLSLCIVYMQNFSEYEAMRLASFERYIHIAFLALWIMILFVALDALVRWFDKNDALFVALVYLILVIVPIRPVVNFALKNGVKASSERRSSYAYLSDKIMDVCEEGSKIYFISQEDNGYDYYVMRYVVRPNSLNATETWSIGEPFYDGDIWTQSKTCEQWQNELITEFDYVAIFRLNDYFVENYGQLFENPNEIDVNSVYAVNKDNGMLEKCE